MSPLQCRHPRRMVCQLRQVRKVPPRRPMPRPAGLARSSSSFRGQTGPNSYQSYAAELAKLGYYSVLFTGADILNPANTGHINLKKAIDRALNSPSAVKGKVAVIGFSLGGGGALYEATAIPDLVSMVVAYYPATSPWSNKIDFVGQALSKSRCL